jgi:NADH:ubiquinone oxidoreductase subunit D
MLSSCSNPKKANKGNCQHAIDNWIEKSPQCLSMPDGSVTVAKQGRGELPVYVEANQAAQSYSEESRQRHLAPLDALVNAGLLKSSRIEVDQGQGMFGSNNRKVAVIAYDFTEKGKSAFKKEEA